MSKTIYTKTILVPVISHALHVSAPILGEEYF